MIVYSGNKQDIIMGKQRAEQAKNNKLTGKKVKIIYEQICKKNIEELLELFFNPDEHNKNPKYKLSRKKVLQRYIREEKASLLDLKKQFTNLKISKLYIEDEPLFTVESFFDSDIASFTKRAKEYQNFQHKASLDIDTEYQYIYMFSSADKPIINNFSKNFTYYKLDYTNAQKIVCDKAIEVKVYPSNIKNIGFYTGTIKRHNTKVVLSIFNEYDYITALFDTSLKSVTQTPLYEDHLFGVAVGINDHNQKIPVAKKVVMTKRVLNGVELEQLYLILNETQMIEAKENLYALESRDDQDSSHLSKYQQKITDIHTFFSNIKYSTLIKTSIMHHMVFTEFHVFKNMYDKFAAFQEYFLHDRKRIYLEFLRYLRIYKEESVYIVLPIFKDKSNIFLYESFEKKSIKELFIDLARGGMKFEIVFVIEKLQDYRNEKMNKVLRELKETGFKLLFVSKNEIENLVESYDFFYTQSKSSVIKKSHIRNTKRFIVTDSKEQIRSSIVDFQRINEHSYTYDEVMDNSCNICQNDLILQKLLGVWHCYSYGSFEDEKNRPVLWEIMLEIKADYTILMKMQDKISSNGKLEVFKEESVFSIQSSQRDGNTFMILTNRKIKPITSLMIYSKQLHKDADMATVGIISRQQLLPEDAKKLLGKYEHSVLKVSPKFQTKIDDFILSYKVSSLNQSR